MVLTATDIAQDSYSGSNEFGRVANPPAIHSIYTKEELEQAYSLFQGSGGVVASMLNFPISGAKTQVTQNSQNKFAAAVNEICAAFGLTKEELAQVCHIQSRKTLYNWINGETSPRKSAVSRIFNLLAVAQAWKHAGFSSERDLLRQPVLDGENLFDILNQPTIDQELILFIGSRLNFMSPSKSAISDPFA